MSEPSREKLRVCKEREFHELIMTFCQIQNIVETLRPQLCECKVILQEIIWSLTPDRCCKNMTQALAERAVEVTSNVSYLLEGAEETPQLLDNIFQLEQYDFLLPSEFHILTVSSLGPCVIFTCSCNRRPSGTCYSAYCLQSICGFVTFPLISS